MFLAKQQRRRAKLRARMEVRAADAEELCVVPGCRREPEARAGRGLSLTVCRYHVQHRSRHGSFRRGTLLAKTLDPYRKAAERFLRVHGADPGVAAGAKRVASWLTWDGISRDPGQVKSRFLSPHEKARAAIGRLGEREVPPERILVAYLAVSGAIEELSERCYEDDPSEYRRVQVAKAVFRLASGFHSVYGPGPRQRFDRYPRSTGKVLRCLGARLDEACGDFAADHLPAILSLKAGATAIPKAPPIDLPQVIDGCPLGCGERCLAPDAMSCAKHLAEYP